MEVFQGLKKMAPVWTRYYKNTAGIDSGSFIFILS